MMEKSHSRRLNQSRRSVRKDMKGKQNPEGLRHGLCGFNSYVNIQHVIMFCSMSVVLYSLQVSPDNSLIHNRETHEVNDYLVYCDGDIVYGIKTCVNPVNVDVSRVSSWWLSKTLCFAHYPRDRRPSATRHDLVSVGLPGMYCYEELGNPNSVVRKMEHYIDMFAFQFAMYNPTHIYVFQSVVRSMEHDIDMSEYQYAMYSSTHIYVFQSACVPTTQIIPNGQWDMRQRAILKELYADGHLDAQLLTQVYNVWIVSVLSARLPTSSQRIKANPFVVSDFFCRRISIVSQKPESTFRRLDYVWRCTCPYDECQYDQMCLNTAQTQTYLYLCKYLITPEYVLPLMETTAYSGQSVSRYGHEPYVSRVETIFVIGDLYIRYHYAIDDCLYTYDYIFQFYYANSRDVDVATDDHDMGPRWQWGLRTSDRGTCDAWRQPSLLLLCRDTYSYIIVYISNCMIIDSTDYGRSINYFLLYDKMCYEKPHHEPSERRSMIYIVMYLCIKARPYVRALRHAIIVINLTCQPYRWMAILRNDLNHQQIMFKYYLVRCRQYNALFEGGKTVCANLLRCNCAEATLICTLMEFVSISLQSNPLYTPTISTVYARDDILTCNQLRHGNASIPAHVNPRWESHPILISDGNGCMRAQHDESLCQFYIRIGNDCSISFVCTGRSSSTEPKNQMWFPCLGPQYRGDLAGVWRIHSEQICSIRVPVLCICPDAKCYVVYLYYTEICKVVLRYILSWRP